MSSQSPDPPWGGQTTDPVAIVRVMQIICGALIMGVVGFTAIAIFIKVGQQNAVPAADNIVIAYLGAGFAALCIAVRFIVPSQTVNTGVQQLLKTRRADDLTRRDFYQLYQIQMIVGCAVLEGAGFFNGISYLIAGQSWSLAIIAGLVGLMGSSFPTVNKVNNWADDRLRQIQLDPPRSA